MNIRTIFFSLLAILFVWFLFIERAILAPFIFAAIFAYIFNPFVNFFSEKLKVHRAVGILLLFVVLLVPIVISGIILSRVVSLESLDLNQFVSTTLSSARAETHNLPDFLQPVANDLLISLQKSRFFRMVEAPNIELFFSQAISRVLTAFIFLFSTIYFLKDGQQFVHHLLTFIPRKYKVDVEILLRKINVVLGGYLRGQLFLVFFAVIAGGHIGGILGLILAVPTAAVIRLLFEFALDRINEKS